MRKVLRVLAWIFFFPIMFPIWLSYKYPIWLRWVYWVIAVLLLIAAASTENETKGATSGALVLISIAAILLFGLVKLYGLIWGIMDRTFTPAAATTPTILAAMPQARQPPQSVNPDFDTLDTMDGIAFEYFVADLLTSRGYKTQVTQASNDYGIDVIAIKDNVRFGVQVKRYTNGVSRTAVSDAVAGARHWQCHASMVVTNSYFTPGAKEVANSTGCVLVDRATLTHWLAEKKGNHVSS